MALSMHAFGQTGSQWKVQYAWQGFKMENVSSKKATIVIAIAENKISGISGCNKFEGNLQYLKGDKIKPIKLVNTKDKCPKDPDPVDQAIMKALSTSDKLIINLDKAKFYHGEKLVLELNR